MSFRNTDFVNNDSNSAQPRKKAPLSLGATLRAAELSALERTVGKIASTVVDLHEGYLSKCANLEIYRNLSSEEQELLDEIQNNSSLHTALTGILAIDSCVKTLQKEEDRVMQGVSSSLAEVLQNFKDLEGQICKFDQHFDLSNYCQRLSESLKELIHQIYALPAAKCRMHQLEKFFIILEQSQLKPELDDKFNKQTDGENQRLRRMVQQKQAQINRLQAKQRIPKLERLEDKKTYNLGFRTSRQRSTTQNDSNSPGQFKKTFGQVMVLKQQLKEKNSIIERMNDEFASEMEKYNSVFKRIQQENRLLKKYVDIDTAYLLEQLQIEIQALRQEKRKDQFIINDIQRKIEGISMARTSRVNTRTPFDYQREIPMEYNNQHYPSYEPFIYRDTPQNKFYSPNLAPSRHSPYIRQVQRQQSPIQSYPFKERSKHIIPNGKKFIQGQFTRKSRSKQISNGRQLRQNGEPDLGQPNLFERVMLRR